MTPSEYFTAAKIASDAKSDYELAKKLGIPNGQFSLMRRGLRTIPNDVVFKLAITLDHDPAEVLADIEAQQDPSEKRREFWRGFLSRAGKVAAVLMLAWTFTASSGSGPGTHGGHESIRMASALIIGAVLFWLWRVRIIK